MKGEIVCECGKHYTYKNDYEINRHNSSKYHQAFLNGLTPELREQQKRERKLNRRHEYYIENKEKHIEYSKNYHQEHKDERKEYYKNYRKI